MATSKRREAESFDEVGCSVAEAVGDFVYYSAAGQVRKVDIDDPSKMWALGVVIQKPTPTTCTVQLSGVVVGLFSLLMGKPVFANENAQASQIISYPLVGVRFNQIVGIPVGPADLKLEFQTPIGVIPL